MTGCGDCGVRGSWAEGAPVSFVNPSRDPRRLQAPTPTTTPTPTPTTTPPSTPRPGATLWLVVTRLCQFACAGCYQGAHSHHRCEDLGLTRTMSDRIMGATLEWASSWGNDNLRVNWYGGEPLLTYPFMRHWVPLWAHAFPKGKQSVTTNGQLLTPKVRDFLDEWHMGVLLSLDGPRERHNRSRVDATGAGTWDRIPIREILKWRPGIEIAWKLSPKIWAFPSHLDEMLAWGFRNINFNIDWIGGAGSWTPTELGWLHTVFRHVGRLGARGVLSSNWLGKLDKVLRNKPRPGQPCGTGRAMLAATPEGWLYPSQEMAFMALEPDRLPGTALRYRVGDVLEDPVIDDEHLKSTAAIYTDQLIPGPGHNCDTCIGAAACVGGCHCRHVGQINRHGIPEDHCTTMKAAISGILEGTVMEGGLQRRREGPQPSFFAFEKAIRADLKKINDKLDTAPIVVIEKE